MRDLKKILEREENITRKEAKAIIKQVEDFNKSKKLFEEIWQIDDIEAFIINSKGEPTNKGHLLCISGDGVEFFLRIIK